MAWRDNLLDASFRGVVFHIKNVKGSNKRALVEHSYPFRNGAKLEDNGLNARRYQLTAVFWGDDYEASLQQFIEALDEGGEGEFIHPVYGSIPVMVEGYDDPYEAERPDYLELAVTFVESGRENPFFQREFSAATQAENQGENALAKADEATDSLGQQLAAYINEIGESLSVAMQLEVLDDIHGLIADYQEVKSVVLSGLNYLDFPAALVSDLNAIISEVAWLVDLSPDSITGHFRGWQQLSNLFSRLSINRGEAASSYPATTSAYNGVTISGSNASQQTAIVEVPAPAKTAGSKLALTPGPVNHTTAAVRVYANLEQTRQVVDGATYVLRQEATLPTLTPPEVETIVGNSRQRLRDSLQEIRLVFGQYAAHDIVQHLRDSALAIQEQGRAVINRRPPLVSHTSDHFSNLHLLAHQLYGDYTRAAEVARLNPALRCPNFISPGMVLKVYAK